MGSQLPHTTLGSASHYERGPSHLVQSELMAQWLMTPMVQANQHISLDSTAKLLTGLECSTTLLTTHLPQRDRVPKANTLILTMIALNCMKKVIILILIELLTAPLVILTVSFRTILLSILVCTRILFRSLTSDDFFSSSHVRLPGLKVYFDETLSEEAKKVLGYLVAKNFRYSFFLPVLTTTFAVFSKGSGNLCHLNKTFHWCAEGLVALVFVDALLWLVEKGSRLFASFSDPAERYLAFRRSERREAKNVLG